MLITKHKPSSLSYLKRAVRATKDGDDTFKDKKLSLVGLAYATDALSEEIPVHVSLENIIFQGKGLTAQIVMKPLPSQLSTIQTLEEFLDLSHMGAFTSDERIEKPVFTTPFKADLLLGNTMFSNIQDYELELYMEDAEVSFTETKFAGEQHYQFVVESKKELTTGEVKQHLILLFKDKTYDGETLFSNLVTTNKVGTPQPKLDKRDTKKVVDLLMEPNVTGLLIGSAMLKPTYDSATAVIYPSQANMQIAESEDQYHFVADTGTLQVNKKDIKYSTVKKVATDKYLLSLYVSDGVIRVSLG